MTLQALAIAVGQLNNSVQVLVPLGVTDPNTNNNTASAVVTAVPLLPADLQITKSVSSTNDPTGVQVAFQLQLNNLGPNNVTNAIVVTDCLPPGYRYFTDSTVIGNSPGTYNPGTCLWTLPAGLATNVTANLKIIATALSVGTYTNTATVVVPYGYTDPNLTNNTASVVTKVSPTYTISGYVLGCQTNGPAIPFVSVTLSGAYGYPTMTDTNGFYRFDALTGETSWKYFQSHQRNAHPEFQYHIAGVHGFCWTNSGPSELWHEREWFVRCLCRACRRPLADRTD